METSLLLVPDDGLQSENLFGNSVHTVVRVTERRSPVLGQPSTSRIVDNLHRPTELSDDLQVGQRSHVRVSPGVNGNVVFENTDHQINSRHIVWHILVYLKNKERTLQVVECPEELLRVLKDVNTNEEMGSMLVDGLEMVIELVRGLR